MNHGRGSIWPPDHRSQMVIPVINAPPNVIVINGQFVDYNRGNSTQSGMSMAFEQRPTQNISWVPPPEYQQPFPNAQLFQYSLPSYLTQAPHQLYQSHQEYQRTARTPPAIMPAQPYQPSPARVFEIPQQPSPSTIQQHHGRTKAFEMQQEPSRFFSRNYNTPGGKMGIPSSSSSEGFPSSRSQNRWPVQNTNTAKKSKLTLPPIFEAVNIDDEPPQPLENPTAIYQPISPPVNTPTPRHTASATTDRRCNSAQRPIERLLNVREQQRRIAYAIETTEAVPTVLDGTEVSTTQRLRTTATCSTRSIATAPPVATGCTVVQESRTMHKRKQTVPLRRITSQVALPVAKPPSATTTPNLSDTSTVIDKETRKGSFVCDHCQMRFSHQAVLSIHCIFRNCRPEDNPKATIVYISKQSAAEGDIEIQRSLKETPKCGDSLVPTVSAAIALTKGTEVNSTMPILAPHFLIPSVFTDELSDRHRPVVTEMSPSCDNYQDDSPPALVPVTASTNSYNEKQHEEPPKPDEVEVSVSKSTTSLMKLPHAKAANDSKTPTTSVEIGRSGSDNCTPPPTTDGCDPLAHGFKSSLRPTNNDTTSVFAASAVNEATPNSSREPTGVVVNLNARAVWLLKKRRKKRTAFYSSGNYKRRDYREELRALIQHGHAGKMANTRQTSTSSTTSTKCRTKSTDDDEASRQRTDKFLTTLNRSSAEQAASAVSTNIPLCQFEGRRRGRKRRLTRRP